MIVDQVGIDRLGAADCAPKALAPDRLPGRGVMGLDIVGHDAVNDQVARFPVACLDSRSDQRGGLGAASIPVERDGEQPADALLADRRLGKNGFMEVGIGARGFETPLGDSDRHIATPLVRGFGVRWGLAPRRFT